MRRARNDRHLTASFLIAGCGSICQRHARNLRALGAVDLLVYDPNPERASKAAAESGAAKVASLEAGLQRRPRAVLVCTPPHLHTAAATAAIAAGAHVFIEKPLADRLEGAEEDRKSVV